MRSIVKISLIFLFSFNFIVSCYAEEEDKGPVIPPSKCEVCKYLATELKDRLEETGKTKEVLQIGHGLDPDKKKKIKYNTAELRLIEALQDPHICDKILQYNIHKEREGSLRFAKGQSETFQTLHNLVNKGVKVVMDVPYELWNETSAEVAELHRQCFTVVERYEETIEDWYFEHQDQDIIDYLCRKHVLKNEDQSCLDEVYVPKGDTEEKEEDTEKKQSAKKKSKKKKDKSKVKGETEEHTEL
ncbi:protein canopy homolog 3-like isoform X2 [Mercenaria mercenaria]|uniref:protein canopy homolog 3-like isoform X2 n=1 Tax=Mercenaria mercenaria TaxID=6596 RepID=UPI00234EBDFC|nr:protein canopy homolog 3-like isoform X2 [Mercenaria mercenaria]